MKSRDRLAVRSNLAMAGAIMLANLLLAGVLSAAPNSTPAPTAAKPAAASTPARSARPIDGIDMINGIVLVPRLEDVNKAGITGVKGVEIKGLAFLQGPDLTGQLSRYLNAPLTKDALDSMQTDIIKYCRKKGHLVVDVFFPEEEVKEGIIQIAVIEARIGKISVNNEGKKWFSDSLILGNLRLKSGDVVVAPGLNADLNWLNRNTYQSLGYFDGTFREVGATFEQGGLGQTDLKLNVQDRMPFRVFAGYDDSGIKVIGDDRVFAGFNWANAWGLDQRLNYQFIADTSFQELREHIATYTIPLPWHHEFTLLGAYADLNPDLSVIDPSLANFKNNGDYYQISARYTIPLPELNNYDQEISVGVDYKNTDTPLFFGSGSTLLTTGIVSVLQFSLNYTGVMKDRWGRTALTVQGVYSPGNIVGNDDNGAYQNFARDPNITSDYIYGRVEVRRETMLPGGFVWFLRGMGQLSDADLLPTETFGLGGYDTVRGYDERIVSGDNGWLLVNELRTPRIKTSNLTRQKGMEDWIQGLIFLDYGGVMLRTPPIGYNSSEQLLSAGAGLRFQIANNICLRLDYGFQIDRDYANQATIFVKNEPSSRVHLGVEVSY